MYGRLKNLFHKGVMSRSYLTPVGIRIARHLVVIINTVIPLMSYTVDNKSLISAVNRIFNSLNVFLGSIRSLKLKVVEVELICVISYTTILRVDCGNSTTRSVGYALRQSQRRKSLTASAWTRE